MINQTAPIPRTKSTFEVVLVSGLLLGLFVWLLPKRGR